MEFPYEVSDITAPRLGLIALQSDETIERDFRRLIPDSGELLVSRVPSALEVSQATLGEMAHHLTDAAGLFPRATHFAAVGYGCTSGASVIGPEKVAGLVQAGVDTQAVTEPVSALLAACSALGVRRLGFLSPYVQEVSATLRGVLATQGVATPVFGTFNEAEEEKVVRISARSISAAATQLCDGGDVDALFLSCTNLRTLDVIDDIEARLNLPVLSSNQVLAWHMCALAGIETPWGRYGRIWGRTRRNGKDPA